MSDLDVTCPYCHESIGIMNFEDHRQNACGEFKKKPMTVLSAVRCVICRHLVDRAEIEAHTEQCEKEHKAGSLWKSEDPVHEEEVPKARYCKDGMHFFQTGDAFFCSSAGALLCKSHTHYPMACCEIHDVTNPRDLERCRCGIHAEYFCESSNEFLCWHHHHSLAGSIFECCMRISDITRGRGTAPAPKEEVPEPPKGYGRDGCRLVKVTDSEEVKQ